MFNASDTRNEQAYLAGYKQFAQSGCMGRHFCGRGSNHKYKYRLAYVVEDKCVLRYDNEAGKGDHKHLDTVEISINFIDINQLIDDFIAEVN